MTSTLPDFEEGLPLGSAFQPSSIGLRSDFRLTDFSKMKGCACKLPRAQLLEYLTSIPNTLRPNETPGMDCSVVATKFPGIYTVSTTDCFFSVVENPYMQGRITACNVLSDAYAMGIVDVDTVLMILAISNDMTEDEKRIVTKEAIRGFTDACHEAGTSVTGGQTIRNNWPIFGGVATGVVSEADMVRPEGAQPGDKLVLTKCVGNQAAVNVWQWRTGGSDWAMVAGSSKVDLPLAAKAYDRAVKNMSRLNRNAARLLHTHGAHAATDITGFGLLGHARNMASHTKENVEFRINYVPFIPGVLTMDDASNGYFKLRGGLSAETSGGLLVALPADKAQAYIDELRAVDKADAWIVGDVVKTEGNRDAFFTDDCKFEEIVDSYPN